MEHTRKRKKPRLPAGFCTLAGGLLRELNGTLRDVHTLGQTTRIPSHEADILLRRLTLRERDHVSEDEVNLAGGAGDAALHLQFVTVTTLHNSHSGEFLVGQLVNEGNALECLHAFRHGCDEVAAGTEGGAENLSAVGDLAPVRGEREEEVRRRFDGIHPRDGATLRAEDAIRAVAGGGALDSEREEFAGEVHGQSP